MIAGTEAVFADTQLLSRNSHSQREETGKANALIE